MQKKVKARANRLAERLSRLGHQIDLNCWEQCEKGYVNYCLNCGQPAILSKKTGKAVGRILSSSRAQMTQDDFACLKP
ncbi:MAG: hypothetical protein NVS1B11_28180 [Terriglobales bacterium]